MSYLYCGLLIAVLFLKSGFLNSEEQTQSVACESIKTPTRPQEPKLPYPYDAVEVSFKNASDGVVLAGTLTLPRSQGPFPVVVLLHGSAPLDRDSPLFGHRPFLVWADYLTKQGIAVLRFDKRSAGKSTGDYSTATVQDFAKDALAAVDYLKTRKEINVKQIGLIGHSEGGMTASLAASQSQDVAFIVLLAAASVNGEELVHMQQGLLQRVDGVQEEVIVQGRKIRDQIFVILKEEKNRKIAEEKLRASLTTHLDKLMPPQRKIVETYCGTMEEQIKLSNSTWFRYWFTYDP